MQRRRAIDMVGELVGQGKLGRRINANVEWMQMRQNVIQSSALCL